MEAKLECAVCMQEFNEDQHEPRLAPRCGHTLCKSCLLQIAKIDGIAIAEFMEIPRRIEFEDTRMANLTFTCPFCISKTSKDFPAKSPQSDILNHFPVNFTLVSAISIIKKAPIIYETCQLHGLPCNIACFDPHCCHRKYACLDCLKVEHSNCRSFFAIDRGSIESRIEIVDYERKYENIVKTLREVKESIIRRFHKKISRAFNIFAEKLKTVFYTIDTSSDSFFGPELKNWTISTSDNSKTPRIRLMPRNKRKIDEELTVQKLYEKFKDLYQEHLADMPPTTFDAFLNELANPKKRIQIL